MKRCIAWGICMILGLSLICVYDLLNCPNPDLLDCPPID